MIKRLLLTFGLVIAFFVSPVQASIYDSAGWLPPKINSVTPVMCRDSNGGKQRNFPSESDCIEFYELQIESNSLRTDAICTVSSQILDCTYIRRIGTDSNGDAIYTRSSPEKYATVYYLPPETSRTCPPDSNPLYMVDHDSDGDGEIDRCYNPDELDNASQCQNQVGNMLPALSNGIADKVCKTDSNTGASCGYSRPANSGNPSYALDLEMNCFGENGENVPEYEPETLPEPETCNQVNNGLMVCKADPNEKCDASGVCQDQCGFVNDVFMCFHECKGDECGQTTPPTVEPPEPPEPEFCKENPTHPDCIETPPPTPEFCEENPTHPDCVTEPEPEGDLGEVIKAIKEIGDKIDEFFTLEGTLPSVEVDSTQFKDFFTPLIDEKYAKIEENKEQIKTLLEESPLKLGTPSFTSGSYSPTEFTINQGGGSVTVSFNLFEKLGANAAYVRGAILFAAAMLAAMIVLSSGRGR